MAATILPTNVITLPCKSNHTHVQNELQFYIGATQTLEDELNAERLRTKTLKQNMQQQQQHHDAEARRFVGQNARLNTEIKNLMAQLERLRDVCGFD